MSKFTKEQLQQISAQIKEGYTEGNNPRWVLDSNDSLKLTDEERNKISVLVGQGFTQGFCPSWMLLCQDD